MSAKQDLARLQTELGAQDSLDAAGFAAKASVPFADLGSYDTSMTSVMDLIQKSTLALSDKELAILAKRGFVVSSAHTFPTFAYGYISIYGADLPLYISADSILNAVHESYDSILADIESRWLASARSQVIDCLPRLSAMKPTASPSTKGGPHLRASSPSGRSTFTTSAPRKARIWPQ